MTTSTLDGTYNFRDVGGMPLIAGGTTTPGILYRSDALSELTPTGLEELAASDIGVIVDFRTAMERQMAPDRLPSARPFEIIELPLLEGAFAGAAQQAAQAAAAAGPEAAEAANEAIADAVAHMPTLGEIYIGMLEHAADAFAQVARRVSVATAEPPTAVLVHCSAGKDRTGVACALMLDAVGVQRDAIIADYISSEANLAGEWAAKVFARVTQSGVPLTPAITTIIAGTPRAALEQAFAWIDERRGDSASYLRSGGLTDAELAVLRARLTT
ncbi:tyrosine-protein phosphatase [uncultured Microbacterium sp.]|uniref:tyrosine-protein phosphatase n=1 Tax=uncultured Microbacterium sp. TaxID=191216 RepID=UPI0035CCA99A